MKTITIEINGLEINAEAGKTILEVVQENNLDDIPTLCHSPELKPYGSCFVCVVEVEGRPNLLPSCATRVTPGMKIMTRSERVISARRTALELLLSNHYADCVSPCMLGCPAGVDAQGYIALAAMGQFRKAIDLIREANPLPSVCARICVRKCEDVCRRMDVDESVGINFIKRYLSDAPDAFDGTPSREPSRGKSIGIVGAGPAALTAGWFLGRQGYDPVLYESMQKPGGMLRYGIPEYRLPKDVLDREIDYIYRVGVQIETGIHIGRDIQLQELMKKHDAVFIAAGAMGSSPMRIEGEFDTEGIMPGVEFLIEKTDNPESLSGMVVVVVGGGNTAMDAARISWRLDADKVIILYRRTKAEMPADDMEIEDCLKEGVEIMELAAPISIVKENSKLKALRCIRMKLGEPDASGRRRPVPLEGSEFELPCDIAVPAIGQRPILEGLIKVSDNDPKLTRWNTIINDPKTMKTNIEGLFTGGDVADDGPTVVIDAIRDGQIAAKAIHSYLSGEEMDHEPFISRKDFWAKPGRTELGDVPESPRHHLQEIEVEDRKGNFNEVATGFEYEDMAHEAERCLSCGCVKYSDCALQKYADQYDVDLNRFKGYIRKHKVDDSHPYIVYDPNKCILCARCVRTCARILPIAALGLMNRGFSTEMRPAMNDPLVQTNCISCGNCVDSCPTGALTVKTPYPGRADLTAAEVEDHCGMCSIGCGITVHRISNDRYFIAGSGKPGDYLCYYGRFGNELFIQSRRLATPIQRDKSIHNEVSFTYANRQIVEGFKEMAEKYGPEAIAVFVSPDLTNEEMYLAARIAREGIGTNNIGSLTALGTISESGVLDESIGFTQSTADRSVIADADVILCNNIDMENESPVLGVDVIDAVTSGGKLIVCNSSVVPLEKIASIRLDPMRGRAALLWNGVMQILLDGGYFDRKKVSQLKGGEEFLNDMFDYSPQSISNWTGVQEEKLFATAEEIQNAKKVVILHCPDRAHDLAPGDIKVLANFVIILRSIGVQADLILPGITSNKAGLELVGADPGFLAGRIPSTELPGIHSHGEMRELLTSGRLKAAFVVGEDPIRDDRTASYFRNIEFLVAMDWTQTETTMLADISLPGATYLESRGTRCNFEGRLIRFNQSITPPSNVPGWKVLAQLATFFEIDGIGESAAEITQQIDTIIRDNLDGMLPFYWNTGEKRVWDGRGKLVVADVRTKPNPIQPPLTATEQYKRETREVGIERYRVR